MKLICDVSRFNVHIGLHIILITISNEESSHVFFNFNVP